MTPLLMKNTPPARAEIIAASTYTVSRIRERLTPVTRAASTSSRMAISPRPIRERVTPYTSATAPQHTVSAIR